VNAIPPDPPAPPDPPSPPAPKRGGSPPDWLAGWSQIVSNAVVFVGAGFAVWQVLELRADRARDNAMQYVMLLHEESYARVALDLSVALQEGAGADDPRLSLTNVQQLGDLYQSAITCRESGVCDRDTIDIHLRDTVAGFYNLTYDDELVRLSCRLGLRPTEYGDPLRAYLDSSREGSSPAASVSTRACA
jgi:hypothetical protein